VPSQLFAIGNGNGTRETWDFSARSIAQIRQFYFVWLGEIHVENWLWFFHLGEDFGLQCDAVAFVVLLNGLFEFQNIFTKSYNIYLN